MSSRPSHSRRRFLGQMAFGAAAFTTPGLFAELLQTPPQGEGPFYPDKLPLDTDNDLLLVNDKITPAVGDITHLSGRILDARGAPLRNAVVEIWQADNNGVYIHSGSANSAKLDGNFQGFGRFLTGRKGEYYFRTIKPKPYPGRAPHIHFAIKAKGRDRFVTQCYVKGEAANEKDVLLNRVKEKKARDSLIVDFQPLKKTDTGELQATFDVVLGVTPKDSE